MCPKLNDVAERKVSEIVLYKTKGFYGESAVSEVLCPINGKRRFTYTKTKTPVQVLLPEQGTVLRGTSLIFSLGAAVFQTRKCTLNAWEIGKEKMGKFI